MGLINDDAHVRAVCFAGLPHGSEKTCRYLTMHPKGWDCVKLSASSMRSLADIMAGRPAWPNAKAYMDHRVEMGEMNARGDNCEGR